jgi:DNA-binding transcriptional ArsR family regulator
MGSGRSNCSAHIISEKALIDIIRADILRHLGQTETDEQRVVTEIFRRFSETSIEETKRELSTVTARLAELDTLGTKLYEDRLNGRVHQLNIERRGRK